VKKTARSRGEVADTIEQFVQGVCWQRVWDDFCTVPIVDPQLDAIRLRCAGMPEQFPSTQKGHYCSEAGIEVLREMVRELRRPTNFT
jgi:hypothetical protein